MEKLIDKLSVDLSKYVDETHLDVYLALQDDVCKIRCSNNLDDVILFKGFYYERIHDYFELCLYYYLNLPRRLICNIFLSEIIDLFDLYVCGD